MHAPGYSLSTQMTHLQHFFHGYERADQQMSRGINFRPTLPGMKSNNSVTLIYLLFPSVLLHQGFCKMHTRQLRGLRLRGGSVAMHLCVPLAHTRTHTHTHTCVWVNVCLQLTRTRAHTAHRSACENEQSERSDKLDASLLIPVFGHCCPWGSRGRLGRGSADRWTRPAHNPPSP